ncbi:MAG: hypothetical protein FRX49_05689 [Trebouxia sp. A1-2]|nr:MAG: hypothetical protein FRX49_05689 [Trebouxia sp. A1-2]
MTGDYDQKAASVANAATEVAAEQYPTLGSLLPQCHDLGSHTAVASGPLARWGFGYLQWTHRNALAVPRGSLRRCRRSKQANAVKPSSIAIGQPLRFRAPSQMPMLPVKVYGKAEDYSERFYLYQLEGQSAELAFGLLNQHKQDEADISTARAQERDATQQARPHALLVCREDGCWRALNVEELKLQLQQLESKLSTVQSALRQVSIRSPTKSQQFTASLSSLDAFSPSQTLQPSQITHPTKKLRAESSQASPNQDSAVSQDLGAAECGSSMPNSPATQLHTGPSQAAAQEGNATYGLEQEKIQVGQAKVVSRAGRGRGRGRGRQATKIGD